MMSVVLYVVCSSANAYMLMYRRVDKVENAGESTDHWQARQDDACKLARRGGGGRGGIFS